MICTDTALLCIPKASFTFCAKLCFGLRPSQLPFGLYQLLSLSFCKELLNNWIFQKQVKANFQERPTILLWTEQWYYTVLIRADKEGLGKKVFSWHLALWFYIKTTGFARSVLWCSGPWNCNSEPYIASSAAVTEVKFKGIRRYKQMKFGGFFFNKYRWYTLFSRDFDLGAFT